MASGSFRAARVDQSWGEGTVLLVEDEHNIGRLVRSYLERDGYDVIWAGNGDDALFERARHPVRLVVLGATPAARGAGDLRRLTLLALRVL